jgi:Asp-tRNA(Asn)/Glu-tRNA(Gln) amidotransferase A subunit family amidase
MQQQELAKPPIPTILAIHQEVVPAAHPYTHILMCSGLANHHGKDADQYSEQISPPLHHLIQQGETQSPLDYAQAKQMAVRYRVVLKQILAQYDAILTSVTMGTAPLGLEDTESPVFCSLWTLCGLPAISTPIGSAENGLPLAIQLVGRRAEDEDLLAIAH